jgi:hypothetical protein
MDRCVAGYHNWETKGAAFANDLCQRLCIIGPDQSLIDQWWGKIHTLALSFLCCYHCEGLWEELCANFGPGDCLRQRHMPYCLAQRVILWLCHWNSQMSIVWSNHDMKKNSEWTVVYSGLKRSIDYAAERRFLQNCHVATMVHLFKHNGLAERVVL